MILGEPVSWTQRLVDVHALFLDRIAEVWPRCAAYFDSQAKENSMTDHLVLALRKDPVVGPRFLIESQHKLLDEDCRGDVVTKGFVDIAVFFTLRQHVYLAFECKRLNVRYEGGRHSLAGEYADQGLMRYLSAQYAHDLSFGAMLGYVMDGDVEWGVGRLAASFETRATQLGFDGTLEICPAVACLYCFRTRHRRGDEPDLFEVRHALLSL